MHVKSDNVCQIGPSQNLLFFNSRVVLLMITGSEGFLFF